MREQAKKYLAFALLGILCGFVGMWLYTVAVDWPEWQKDKSFIRAARLGVEAQQQRLLQQQQPATGGGAK